MKEKLCEKKWNKVRIYQIVKLQCCMQAKVVVNHGVPVVFKML